MSSLAHPQQSTVVTGLMPHTQYSKALGNPGTCCPSKQPGLGHPALPTYLVDRVVTVLPVDEGVEDVEVAVWLPLPLCPPPI